MARAMAAVTCSYIEKKKPKGLRTLLIILPQLSIMLLMTTRIARAFFAALTVFRRVSFTEHHKNVFQLHNVFQQTQSSRQKKNMLFALSKLIMSSQRRTPDRLSTAMYLSECVHVLLLLLQIPLALLNKFVDRGPRRWR